VYNVPSESVLLAAAALDDGPIGEAPHPTPAFDPFGPAVSSSPATTSLATGDPVQVQLKTTWSEGARAFDTSLLKRNKFGYIEWRKDTGDIDQIVSSLTIDGQPAM
jgi:hypothetical protein